MMAHPSIFEIRRDVRKFTLRRGSESADRCIVSIAGVTITNSRGQTTLRVAPTGYPAHSLKAQKEQGHDSPIDYIQVSGRTARE